MSRTTKLKVIYVAVLTLVAGAVIFFIESSDWNILVLLTIVLLLLAPGRIQGIFYRDFFTGRRLLGETKYAEAITYFQKFLDSIQRNPNLERLLWLQGSVYTTSAAAMTLNNIGVAQIELGASSAAVGVLKQALQQDAFYPLPHFNLALVMALPGDHVGAQRELAEAQKLGFTGGNVDHVVHKAQSILARIEGRNA